MKKKTFIIPLYEGKITVIKTDDLIKVEKEYNISSLGNLEATVFLYKYRHYIIAFRNFNPGIVTHDALHLVRYIYEDIGVTFSMENDEHQCFLIEWIVNKCYEVLIT